MDKNNKDLGDLLGHSVRMAAMRPSKASNNVKHYERVRDHAKNLYNNLKQSFEMPCGCSLPHYANLRLDARKDGVNPMTRIEHEEILDICFNVLFSHQPNQEKPSSMPRWWRETIIEPVAQPKLEQTTSIASNSQHRHIQAMTSVTDSMVRKTDTTASITITRLALTSLRGQSGAERSGAEYAILYTIELFFTDYCRRVKAQARPKRVSFAPSTTLPINNLTTHDPSSDPNCRPSPDLETIECLCAAIHKATSGAFCHGILVDKSETRHRVRVVKPSLPCDSMHAISLKDLLAQAVKVEKKERLILGVKLALTLLQLHKTPWLEEMWGNQNVFFMKSEEGLPDSHPHHPFLSKQFMSPTCTITPCKLQESYRTPSLEVRNQSIFALGVLLVELWFNQPLESLRVPADMGLHNEVNQVTDFATVRRLSEDIYREAGDWYGDAVRRCIYCDFDQRHNNLESEALKEAVHRGVVSPLEENLRSFCGGRLDDLLA